MWAARGGLVSAGGDGAHRNLEEVKWPTLLLFHGRSGQAGTVTGQRPTPCFSFWAFPYKHGRAGLTGGGSIELTGGPALLASDYQ
jgi:hypothetical protein